MQCWAGRAPGEIIVSIQSVSNDTSSAALQWLLALTSNNSTNATQTRSTSSTSATASTASSTDSALSELSQLVKLFSKLESLAKDDPSAFKKLTAQIASELSDAAKQTTGSESSALQKLADKFTTASQTGSMDALEPPAPSTQSGTSAYSSQNQDINPLALLALLASSGTSTDSNSTAGTDSSQTNGLFQKIYAQVMQA